jgi:predicted membrane chloride channel (bestrophin family)
MGFKTGLVVGLGAGYVLGTRAGRERYEDIRRMWGQLSNSPTVHRAAERTKEVAEVGTKRSMHAVQRGVDKAGTAVKDRLNREDSTQGLGERGQ